MGSQEFPSDLGLELIGNRFVEVYQGSTEDGELKVPVVKSSKSPSGVLLLHRVEQPNTHDLHGIEIQNDFVRPIRCIDTRLGIGCFVARTPVMSPTEILDDRISDALLSDESFFIHYLVLNHAEKALHSKVLRVNHSIHGAVSRACYTFTKRRHLVPLSSISVLTIKELRLKIEHFMGRTEASRAASSHGSTITPSPASRRRRLSKNKATENDGEEEAKTDEEDRDEEEEQHEEEEEEEEEQESARVTTPLKRKRVAVTVLDDSTEDEAGSASVPRSGPRLTARAQMSGNTKRQRRRRLSTWHDASHQLNRSCEEACRLLDDAEKRNLDNPIYQDLFERLRSLPPSIRDIVATFKS